MQITSKGTPSLVGNFCIEHGWVEQDGVVIDPTLHDEGIVYFPGLRFTGERGIAKAMEIPKEKWCKDLPFFFRFGWGGIESPEFRAAIVAAYRYAGWRIRREGTRIGKQFTPRHEPT